MEQWLEVTIRTASGGIDLLCAELTEAGFDSFVIDDSEQFRQFLDGARAYWDYVDEKLAARMRDLSQVRLYLPEETAEAQLAELRALLAELPGRYPACEFGPLTLALDRIPGEDWANSWKQNYRPLPVGERLLVVPQWMTVDDLQGRLPVILDLGLTFGTGEHASTQLCMRALESLVRRRSVADLGGGGGIFRQCPAARPATPSASISIRRGHIAAANTAQGLRLDHFAARTGDIIRSGFLEGWRGRHGHRCADMCGSSSVAPVASSCGRMRRCLRNILDAGDDVRAALAPPGWRLSMRHTRVNGAA
ncbi:MAG: 50S ribosomal protein L11 methyltransferase [Oscillospiraceae bacterium]